MRLINADALREQLQNLAYDDWNQGVSTSWADAYREVADMVEDAPTIEPVRMKGKWVRNIHDKVICNQCGMFGNNEWNFCPNCGAEMRATDA